VAIYATSGDDVVTGLVILAVLLIAVRGLAWNRVKRLLARGWLTNQGGVEFGSVEERRVRYFSYYVSRLDYSYSVNGEYFSGHFERAFVREGSADKFLASMKGQAVFVRSNPRHPDHSALLKEDQPGGWPA
jgi:Protein of unknown function (DUF3592)